jgi:filamentous hemagglutinin family protein
MSSRSFLNIRSQVHYAVVLLTVVFGALVTAPASAQRITPANDGTGTVVRPNGNRIDIEGGALSRDGRNLFHSFEQFGLNREQIANFLSRPEIRNILGRVVGGDASIIDGLIRVSGGNANLFLLNPAGVIFGRNARLDVPGSLTVTTANGLRFDDRWFNVVGANSYADLLGDPNGFAFTMSQPGAIINAGELVVSEGSSLSLLGGTVVNTGRIAAPGGDILITAVPGENLIRIRREGMVLELEVELTSGLSGLPNDVLSNPATLAQLLTVGGGTDTGLAVAPDNSVRLTESNTVIPTEPGTAIASGSLDASTQRTVLPEINVLGDRVGLVGANIDASGANGGGLVRIGGDYQGQGTVPNAERTFVSRDSVINADALATGEGGRVIVWADDTTQFFGNISARGGLTLGNGGFVEVSGKENLSFQGGVDLSAVNGNIGTLLLDPTDIIIANGSGGANDAELIGDNQILATDSPNGTFSISQATLESLPASANISLNASDNILINSLDNNQLSFAPPAQGAAGGAISFNAGGSFTMNTGDSISAPSRNLTISASGGNITVGSLNTSSSLSSGGAITLSASGNIETQSINTYTTQIALSSTNGQPFSGGGITISGRNINTVAGAIVSGRDPNRPRDTFGSGGNITLTASNNITTQTISSEAGSGGRFRGGDINLNSTGISGAIDTTAGQVTSGGAPNSTGGAGIGGNIRLEAGGDIRTQSISSEVGNSAPSGSITITSRNGAINVENIFSGRGVEGPGLPPSGEFLGGTGGDITLDAAGNITTQSIVFENSRSLRGGNINLISRNGSITTGNIISGRNSPSISIPGNISLEANNITTQSIRTTVGNGLSSGRITLRRRDGAINFTALEEISSSSLISDPTGLTNGSLTVSAPNQINIRDITLNGASLNLGSASNRISALQFSNSLSLTDGDINLFLSNDFNLPQNIATDGGNFSLNVLGNIDTSNAFINTSSTNPDRPNAGTISLISSRNITTGDLVSSATGNGNGGSIDLDTRSIATDNAGGRIRVSNLNSSATNRNGGSINLNALGNVDFNSITLGSIAGQNDGELRIRTPRQVNLNPVTFNGADLTLGGDRNNRISNLQFLSDINTGGGNFRAFLSSNNYTLPRNISTGGGDFTFNTLGSINTRATIINTSAPGRGGLISLIGQQENVITGNLILGTSVEPSALRISTPGNIRLGSVTASGSNLRLGSANNPINNFTVNGDIDLGGGSLEITSRGNIQLGSVLTEESNIQFGSVRTEGGNIFLRGNVVNTNQLNSGVRSGTGGDIEILAADRIRTGNITSRSRDGDAGDITLDPPSDIQVTSIDARGGNRGGNIKVETEGAFRATGTVNGNASIMTSQGGIINFDFSGDETGAFIVSSDDISRTSSGTAGIITSGEASIPPGSYPFGYAAPPTIAVSTTAVPPVERDVVQQEDQKEQDDSQPSGIPSLQTNQTNFLPVDIGVSELEESFTIEYEDYFKQVDQQISSSTQSIPSSSQPSEQQSNSGSSNSQTPSYRFKSGTLIEISSTLRNILDQTKIKPAVIYASFVPANTTTEEGVQQIQEFERTQTLMQSRSTVLNSQVYDQLQLVLVTPDQRPISILIPVTRGEVEKTVNDLYTKIYEKSYQQTNAYQDAARKLYQWLIAPLEQYESSDTNYLKKQEIRNLVFVLDRNLRSIPLAALLDKEDKFLVEKYSIGVVPSLSLTDPTLVKLQNAQVLAMGATKFDSGLSTLGSTELQITSIFKEDLWKKLREPILEDQFKREAIFNLSPAGIVHIMTHASFPRNDLPTNNTLPFIQLWGKEQLRLGEIRQLNWKEKVNLLVLAACETAVGDPRSELGFSGAAAQSGISSVLGSLWETSQEGNLALIVEFYRQLRYAPIKAEAVRQAQIQMINRQNNGIMYDPEKQEVVLPALIDEEGNQLLNPLPIPVDGITDQITTTANLDFSHPFYWAGFTMVGSPW